MYDQAVVRTGIRYGVLCALVSFAVTLVIFLAGHNPYGQTSLFSLIAMPAFIFAGCAYFKKFNDQNVGFLKALRVALAITFYAALASAMFLYIFSEFAGVEAIQRHITEMKVILETTRTETIKLIGEANYKLTIDQLDKTTPYYLAVDDFMKKLFTGLLISIVAAVYFRK
ncbi:MAG: hypothetical protein JWQ14_2248 [Adhaeribacter sp.]|nr:hypothetical protein [Adhaeribacter sp.]